MAIPDDKTIVKSVITKDLKEKAEFVAEYENKSLSNLIGVLLSKYVAEHFWDYLSDVNRKKIPTPPGYVCKEVKDKQGKTIINCYLISTSSPVFANGDKEYLTEEDVSLHELSLISNM